MRRKPHIVTFEEEERILAAAEPHMRALVVLVLETGLRSKREALVLRWADVDFVNDFIFASCSLLPSIGWLLVVYAWLNVLITFLVSSNFKFFSL